MTEEPSVARRSVLGQIFVSPAEPRLRAGWRLMLQVLLQVALTLGAGCVLVFAAGGLATQSVGLSAASGLAIAEAVQVVTVTLSVFLARRLLDKRSFLSLGLNLDMRVLPEILLGIAITFIMMGMIFLAEWWLGWITPTGLAWNTEDPTYVVANVLVFLAVFILVGWNEELMSRGYHLQTIASGLGLPWGLIISSAVFGLLHLGNPHATWISAAGIFFAGILLGFAYVCTHRLWLSIGLHIGWNFFEGVVFGFPVSGLTIYHLTRISAGGPELWTGGAFGPEAGLIMLPAIAVGLGLIYVFTRNYSQP